MQKFINPNITMKIIGIILTILGAISLVVGVVGIFQADLLPSNPWIFAILGVVFFSSGIGLMKSVAGSEGGNGEGS